VQSNIPSKPDLHNMPMPFISSLKQLSVPHGLHHINMQIYQSHISECKSFRYSITAPRQHILQVLNDP